MGGVDRWGSLLLMGSVIAAQRVSFAQPRPGRHGPYAGRLLCCHPAAFTSTSILLASGRPASTGPCPSPRLSSKHPLHMVLLLSQEGALRACAVADVAMGFQAILSIVRYGLRSGMLAYVYW